MASRPGDACLLQFAWRRRVLLRAAGFLSRRRGSERLLHNSSRRRALVGLEVRIRRGLRRRHMLQLRDCRRHMRRLDRHDLRRRRLSDDALGSAIKAGARGIVVNDHCLVVDVRDVDIRDIVDSSVVIELIVAPLAAVIARARIAVTVVYPTVKTDGSAPISGAEHIDPVIPAPITRGPQQAEAGRRYPGARHPVIILVIGVPGPITGRPNVAGLRQRRLHVDGQGRRRNIDADADRDLRRSRHRERHRR